MKKLLLIISTQITYRKAEREILQGADKYVEDNVTANIEFQKRIAGTHSTQGNRLNNIYYRMSSGTKRSQEAKEANELHIQNTIEAYFQDVAKSKRVITALSQQRAQQELDVLQKLRLEMREEMSEIAANI